MNLAELLEDTSVSLREDSCNHRDTAILFSSYANSKGGTVLFGIRKNGKIKGVHPQNIIEDINYALDTFCDSPIVWRHDKLIEGRHLLLEVHVSEDEKKVSIKNSIQKEYYSWIGNTFVQVNKIILKVWSLESGRSELKELDMVEKDIVQLIKNKDKISLSLLYKNVKGKNSIVESGLAQLIYKNSIFVICDNDELKYSLVDIID